MRNTFMLLYYGQQRPFWLGGGLNDTLCHPRCFNLCSRESLWPIRTHYVLLMAHFPGLYPRQLGKKSK